MKDKVNVKPVRGGIECPKCNEDDVVGYCATDFGNEKATLICEHLSGRRCTQEVTLLDAHQFEARSKDKFDFGRKW